MNQITREKALENLITFKTTWGEKLNTETDCLGNFEDRYDRQFFINLLACFGNDISTANVFQTRATRRSTGRLGKIDLYCPGLVIGEAKSPGKETLDEAFEQLSDYLWDEKLDQEYVPNYAITTNFETFRVDKLGPRGISESKIEFSLTDIDSHVDELMFLAGFETTLEEEVQKEASFEAVDLMTDIYKSLQGNNSVELESTDVDESHTVAVAQFMTRILFLLFGDDANLWKKNLFTEFIEKSSPNSIVADLNTLFYVLNTPIDKRPSNLPEHINSFPYVNGGVFDTEQTQQMPPLVFFDESMYEALHEASLFDWSNISPAVFGSLFQLVKSKEARRKDGEHYTSEEDILKVLEPMFLDEFRDKTRRLVENSSTSRKDVADFHAQLASHTFVDPACGSGNFLIVAYREIRRIENMLIQKRREFDNEKMGTLFIDMYRKINLGQFYGFEIGWWPAKIAETALFLIEQQCNKELADLIGEMPSMLPITDSATIVHGNALQLDWEDILPDRVAGGGRTFIFGNPPFVGQRQKSEDPQKEADMRHVWGKKYNGYLDYVTGWMKKSADYLFNRDGEFAFVSTNSISQGIQVPYLFDPLFDAGWKIKFAHRSFAWNSKAAGKAAVHCNITGFTKDTSIKQRLWEYPDPRGEAVEKQKLDNGINAYLYDADNVIVYSSKKPLSLEINEAVRGYQPTDNGNLYITTRDELDQVLQDPVAAKYVRSLLSTREFLRDIPKWCLWMGDEDFDEREINKSPILKQRVQKNKEYRENAPEKGDAYKLRHVPHQMRLMKNAPKGNYLFVPSITSEKREYMTVKHITDGSITNNRAFTIEDPDGLQFGLISSTMFKTWQDIIGGKMKSDTSFASTVTWNTFPVPSLTEQQKQRIIDTGKKVQAARNSYPDWNLVDLYDPLTMPLGLRKAHEDLDREVDKALGAGRKCTNNKQRIKILFQRYQEITNQNTEEQG